MGDELAKLAERPVVQGNSDRDDVVVDEAENAVIVGLGEKRRNEHCHPLLPL
jgi:hypothetical protein